MNFIGREHPNFEGHSGKNVNVSLKTPPIFLIFLWVVIHFLAVIYCILNLTNSFRDHFLFKSYCKETFGGSLNPPWLGEG